MECERNPPMKILPLGEVHILVNQEELRHQDFYRVIGLGSSGGVLSYNILLEQLSSIFMFSCPLVMISFGFTVSQVPRLVQWCRYVVGRGLEREGERIDLVHHLVGVAAHGKARCLKILPQLYNLPPLPTPNPAPNLTDYLGL